MFNGKTWWKVMFGIIMNMFFILLTDLVNGSNHSKCASLSNQKCEIQPMFINSYADEYSQELH